MLRCLFFMLVIGIAIAIIALAGLVLIPTVIATFGVMAAILAAIVTFIVVLVFLSLIFI